MRDRRRGRVQTRPGSVRGAVPKGRGIEALYRETRLAVAAGLARRGGGVAALSRAVWGPWVERS